MKARRLFLGCRQSASLGMVNIFWLLLFFLPALRAQVNPLPAEAPRFMAVDIYVDSGTESLSAYQLEFTSRNSHAVIVGIEGGEHPAFKEAPFYDPQAMRHERVIIAAFNTAPPEQLPRGKTRVATIHMQTQASVRPEFLLRLEAAGNAQAKAIAAVATFTERNTP